MVFIDDARTPSGQSPFVDIPRPGRNARAAYSHGRRLERRPSGARDDGRRGRSNDRSAGAGFFVSGHLRSARARRPTGNGARPHGSRDPPRPGGAAMVPAALVAFLVAAGLMSGALPSVGVPPTLSALAHGGTTAALGPYLVTRLAFLFPMAQSTWIAIEAVGAAILLTAGGRRRPPGPRRWALRRRSARGSLFRRSERRRRRGRCK